MNQGEDSRGIYKVLELSRWISVLLLLLHVYYYCYGAFREWGLTTILSDQLLDTIARTGIFSDLYASKLMALIFLILSMLGHRSRKDERISLLAGWIFIAAGLLFYFGDTFLLSAGTDLRTSTGLYMMATLAGYLSVLTGARFLSRVISSSLRKRFFSEHAGGFQQEERLIETEYSINLPARYSWNGKQRESYINCINGRRSLLILGNPGCGKSWLIIEPAIRQLIHKSFSLFVFDFKYPVLSSFAYTSFMEYRHLYPPSAAFYCINFTDLSRSHRCNVIHPSTMEYLSDAIGASRTILLSMNKVWVNRQGEFFVESPVNFVAALIWYLKKYKNEAYCTLAHVIEFSQLPYDHLFSLLASEPEINTLINPFVIAYKNKNMELLDSQVASAKIPLGRLASPELYYILTGNDFSLDINDPLAPKIFCLGGDPPRQEALAPVLSLYIDRLNKLINRQGRYKCAIVCDEFATVRAASVLTTIATARSNDIIPILAVQDLNQLRTQYSREEADLLLNIAGNLISGQLGGETARWISERFPPITGYKTTVSMNSSDTSISKSEQTTGAVSPSLIATLSSGEFVGIVADDPDRRLSLKAFHATIEKEEPGKKERKAMPIVRDVKPGDVTEAFMKVKRDIRELEETEMQRILEDPTLVGSMMKK
jgi:hypothetical protein